MALTLFIKFVCAALACAHIASTWNKPAFPFKSVRLPLRPFKISSKADVQLNHPDLNLQPIYFVTYHNDPVSQEDGYIFLSPYTEDLSLEYQLDAQATPVVYDIHDSYLVRLRGSRNRIHLQRQSPRLQWRASSLPSLEVSQMVALISGGMLSLSSPTNSPIR